MYIQVTCPQGHKLKARASYAGKQVKCPACGAVIIVPSASLPDTSHQTAGNGAFLGADSHSTPVTNAVLNAPRRPPGQAGAPFLAAEDHATPIVVQCPGCGDKFRAPDQFAGKKVKCPNCSRSIEATPAGRDRADSSVKRPDSPPPHPQSLCNSCMTSDSGSTAQEPESRPASLQDEKVLQWLGERDPEQTAAANGVSGDHTAVTGQPLPAAQPTRPAPLPVRGAAPPTPSSSTPARGPASIPSMSSALELYHPKRKSWLPVEPKHVLCVGIGQGGRSLILGDMISEGMIDQLIPQFSMVSQCRTETSDVGSAEEAVTFIIQKGRERNLNTVVIPSVDVMPEMAAMMGMKRLQFAVGILATVPEGTDPVALVVSGTAESGEKALASALRVNKQRVRDEELRRAQSRASEKAGTSPEKETTTSEGEKGKVGAFGAGERVLQSGDYKCMTCDTIITAHIASSIIAGGSGMDPQNRQLGMQRERTTHFSAGGAFSNCPTCGDALWSLVKVREWWQFWK